MKVFILPGGNGRNDGHWYTWVARELRRQGIDARVLGQNRLSPAGRVRQLQDRYVLDRQVVLVGHSFGGLTALKWLEIAQQPVAGLVLVDASVKAVFEVPQVGKVEKIRRRYLGSWNWKLDIRRAAKFAGRAVVLSERRTEKSYPAWKPGQQVFARELRGRLISGLGKKQHFTAKQEPLVLRTILRLLKQVS